MGAFRVCPHLVENRIELCSHFRKDLKSSKPAKNNSNDTNSSVTTQLHLKAVVVLKLETFYFREHHSIVIFYE